MIVSTYNMLTLHKYTTYFMFISSNVRKQQIHMYITNMFIYTCMYIVYRYIHGTWYIFILQYLFYSVQHSTSPFSFTSKVLHSEAYLNANNQVLADQGSTIFQQCFDMQGSRFDKALQIGASSARSVSEYRLEVEESNQKGTAAAAMASRMFQDEKEELEESRNKDDMDLLLMEEMTEKDDTEKANMPSIPKRLNLGAGTLQGNLGKQVSSKKTTPSLASTQAGTATPVKSSESSLPAIANVATPSPSPQAKVEVDNANAKRAAPSASGGKSGKLVLDPDMQMVANKHLECCEGTPNFKSLADLTPSFFWVKIESGKRYSQAGKIRGVRGLVKLRFCFLL